MNYGIKEIKRIIKFGTIGFSGVIVNLGSLYILVQFFHISPKIAGAISIELSILNNYFWHSRWTFKDRGEKGVIGLIKYNIATIITSQAGNYIVYLLLLKTGLHYILAEILGIGAGAIFNYLFANFWVFR